MSNKYGISILIDFECMMDIDYAIYTLIKYKYNKKPGVFNEYYMNSVDAEFIKTIMLIRYDLNPLSVLLTDEYRSEADSLYKQIMEADYQTILNVAESNDIFSLMETYIKADDITDITVLCKDQSQVDIVKKLDSSKKFKTIISNRKTIDLSKYDALWVAKFINVLEFNPKQLKGKYIYTIRARYNLEPKKSTEIHRLDVAVYVGKTNKLLLASPYSWFDMPVEPLYVEDNQEGIKNDEN